MLRSSPVLLAVYHNAPTVFPFRKPFYDTPHDQDRGKFDPKNRTMDTQKWPKWMDEGADGTGYGIGLNRRHPLSKLRGNMLRNPSNVPRILQMMTQGSYHMSGRKLYYKGGKPPNPSLHPYLNGEPCPVYGWKVTDAGVIRQFNVPNVDKEKGRYRPYVAMQERKIFGTATSASAPSAPKTDVAKPAKPLMKRLFFWK